MIQLSNDIFVVFRKYIKLRDEIGQETVPEGTTPPPDVGPPLAAGPPLAVRARGVGASEPVSDLVSSLYLPFVTKLCTI